MLVDTADAVTLNVGGQRFVTSTATLQRSAPEFYASIVGSRRGLADAGSPTEVIIDRDPRHFPAVLQYLRHGRCTLPDTISGLLDLNAEAEAYQVYNLLDAIAASRSMRVHWRLQNAAPHKQLLQTAADALLAYAFGRDGGEGFPGMMANAVSVDVQVALAATAPVQGRYRCRLTASIAGPADVKRLRHEYEAAGDIEPPLSTSTMRSAFYSGLAPDQQAVWDEIYFLRKNGDAIAFQARQEACFRVALRLQPLEAPSTDAAVRAGEPKPEWLPVYDTTLRFEILLV